MVMGYYPGYPIGDKTKGEFLLYFNHFKINKIMAEILKQTLGVDVDCKNLVVTLGRIKQDWKVELYAYKVLKNTPNGFLQCKSWFEKLIDSETKFQVVMEATGVYHEKFAYFLFDNKIDTAIVLPNKISNYKKTLDQKTINDKSMSEAIAQFGLERNIDTWVKQMLIIEKSGN